MLILSFAPEQAEKWLETTRRTVQRQMNDLNVNVQQRYYYNYSRKDDVILSSK